MLCFMYDIVFKLTTMACSHSAKQVTLFRLTEPGSAAAAQAVFEELGSSRRSLAADRRVPGLSQGAHPDRQGEGFLQQLLGRSKSCREGSVQGGLFCAQTAHPLSCGRGDACLWKQTEEPVGSCSS